MTVTRSKSALTPGQEERLERHHIDSSHVWWWSPRRGVDDFLVRAWRGISLIALPYQQPGLDSDCPGWDDDLSCEVIYALGHGLPVDKVLAAVAGHAQWAHQGPRQLRALGPMDLVEGWADVLRHRSLGCPEPGGCALDGSMYVLDAEPGDYQVVPVTRVACPEMRPSSA